MTGLYKKKKKREREIDFVYVERIKENMGLTWEGTAQLMGLRTTSQIYNYRYCGRAPASRYYAARDALLLHADKEADKERKKILSLFAPI